MMVLPIVAAAAALSSSAPTTTTAVSRIQLDGSNVFTVRPFSSGQDQEELNRLCHDVWGGSDYLPSVAKSFEADPSCEFVIMHEKMHSEDKEDVKESSSRMVVVAAGNKRNFNTDGTMVWLEAIRVSSQHKGRGIGTQLMHELIHRSLRQGATEIWSCTIQDNHAMKQIFNKVSMKYVNSIYMLDFAVMKTLPGWAAASIASSSSSDVTTTTTTKPDNLLKALNVEHLIRDEVKSDVWVPITTVEELYHTLEQLKAHGGGMGHLPGLFKLIWTSEYLDDSLQKGLVLKKVNDDDAAPPAIVALIQDSAIQSLQSKYVCSIAASNPADVESGLWHLCCNNSEIQSTIPTFILALDGCVMASTSSSSSSSSSAFLDALPLRRDNPGVVYRYSSSSV